MYLGGMEMGILIDEEKVLQVALTRIEGIGGAHTRKLIDAFGNAEAVFRAPFKSLLQTGISKEVAAAISGFSGDASIETELAELGRRGIRTVFISDSEYPNNLRSNTDIPALLFYKGTANPNTNKIVAVVGTRRPTPYGKDVTSHLIRQLARPGVLVVSGLALGIDTAAHRAALDNQLPTIGVLAHGLGYLYPQENTSLAKEMLTNGGLLTSHCYYDKPESFHFPDRNAIIAGLCDAVIVIETARKGGSMLTVAKALKYGSSVFAVPGRITEPRSAGCNWLIRKGQATMLTDGEQVLAELGLEWPRGGTGIQASMQLPFFDTHKTKPEERLLTLLKQTDSLDINEIAIQTGMSSSCLALLLLNLELAGKISLMPGQRYRFNPPITQS
jgi:DNA processing protein